jgi:hypothetical protein
MILSHDRHLQGAAGGDPSLFQSWSALHVEILVLRHQLNILGRRSPCRARLTNSDRLFFVWLYRLWPGLLRAVTFLRPETIVRWHRQGFRAYWRWRCGRSVGELLIMNPNRGSRLFRAGGRLPPGIMVSRAA